MLIIGLTGSIATGKSTVSNILRAPPYNLTIIDADLLARKVVEPGTSGYQQIVAHFASTTPDLLLEPSECGGEHGPDGRGRPLNRPALGRRVFGKGEREEKDRKKLGSIVHPAVRREMFKQMAWAYITGAWAVVLDIPLLYESGWERLCGTIIVVAVKDPIIQMKRLRERDEHLTEEDAMNRVSSQTDVREKADRCLRRGNAGVVLWNDSDKTHLTKEIQTAMAQISRSSPQWWAWLLLLFPPLAGASATFSFLRSWLIQRRWLAEKQSERSKL